MAQTKIKAGLFEGIIGNGTDGYFLMSNGDGTMTWSSVITNPTITSIAYPGSVTAADPAGGETITVTGTDFETGATVTIGGTAAPAVSYVSATQITFTTPAKAAGDYDIVVTNTDTGSATYINGISYNGIPTWTTAAGSLGTFASNTTISTITLQATEPDAGTITFNITNGALPTGLSLTGANIDGTTTLETADTLYTFTVTATDDESQATPRTFTITVKKQFIGTENFTINTYTGNGSTQSIEGKIGTAASFDGSSSYIDLGTSSREIISNKSQVTVSSWVYLNSTGVQNFIIYSAESNNTNYGIYDYGNGNIYFQPDNSTSSNRGYISNSGLYSANQWFHVAMVFDGTATGNSNRLKAYINGNLLSLNYDGSIPSTTNTPNDNVWIGGRPSAKLNGKLDQIRFFNKALSSSEVTTLYGENNASSTKSTTDIFDDGSGVALYEFEEGAKDTGGSGQTGYIGDAAKFNGSSSQIALNNLSIGAGDFTVSLWIKPTAITNANYHMTFAQNGYSSGTGIAMYTLGTSTTTANFVPYFSVGGTAYNIVSSSGVSVNQWTHLALVRDYSNNWKAYMNGTLLNTYVSAGLTTDFTNSISYLGRHSNGLYRFNGYIDDVRIYSSALDSNDIGYIANNDTANIPTSNLSYHYELETDATDSVGSVDGVETDITYGFDGTPTNVGFVGTSFEPDLVWIKQRTGTANNHQLYDSVRDATVSNTRIYPNLTNAQVADPTGVTALNSNGFTLGNSGNINDGSSTYVAWCWKAGGAAVTNNNYLFSAEISANPDAGFSIVKTQTGSSTSAVEVQYGEFKYAHGLNQTPELIITKITSATGGWDTLYYPDGTGSTAYGLSLNGTGLAATYTLGTHIVGINSTFAHMWNYPNANTSPSQNIITYNFHSVDGYQKIGTYTGTGSVGSPTITTGFQPRFVIIKNINIAQEWVMIDSVRGNNPAKTLYPNYGNAEATSGNNIDFNSNGFTIQESGGGVNYRSGDTFIYLAIA